MTVSLAQSLSVHGKYKFRVILIIHLLYSTFTCTYAYATVISAHLVPLLSTLALSSSWLLASCMVSVMQTNTVPLWHLKTPLIKHNQSNVCLLLGIFLSLECLCFSSTHQNQTFMAVRHILPLIKNCRFATVTLLKQSFPLLPDYLNSQTDVFVVFCCSYWQVTEVLPFVSK